MNQLSITRLLFIPTGQYHTPGIRPYQLNLRGDALDRLETATNGFTNLGRQSFAGIAGSILRPSSNTVGTLSIPNGWREVRYLFMMEVVDQPAAYDQETSTKILHIKGFTDREGDPTYTGRIDPSMRMFITEVMHTKALTSPTGMPRQRLMNASLLLQRNVGQENDHGGFFAMRPKDVCVTLGNSHVQELAGRVHTDYRTSLGVKPTLSNVGNDLPSDYLSRTLDAYRMGVNSQSRADVEMPQLMGDVANGTMEYSLGDDPFLTHLQVATEFSQGACFSYGELCALFPGLDRDVTKLVPPMNPTRDIGFLAATPQDSKDWGGSNTDTVAASILGSSIPAAMAYAMLTQVSIFVTNDTIDGMPRFEYLSQPQSFVYSGGSLDNNSIYFRDMVLGEIFRDLTMNGNITVTVSLFCDLVMCDMRMNIEIDGQGAVDYTVPTFARGMITPVIANHRDQLEGLSKTMGSIFDEFKPHDLGSGFEDPYDPGYGYNAGSEPISRIITPSNSGGSGSFSL